jgi:adenosylmethionine-8-amino-7-oxononanoate aminotransferase
MSSLVYADQTSVFPRLTGEGYTSIESGEGVWLRATDGREILDACSGGAMTACLGHGVREVADAAAAQGDELSYLYNHHFTNAPQERYADRLLAVAAPEMARVRFVSGGSEANETALRMVRGYHVDRGDAGRWRIISPAQAYHGALMGALALSGRLDLQGPYADYLTSHHHLGLEAWREDDTGEAALAQLDRRIAEAGPDTVAAFFCEPVSGAALPAFSPPAAFWDGLAERRERYGFLVCFDEVVSGMGRTGSWFAGQRLALEPDIVTAGKGIGAGSFPLAAALCTERVYDAFANGSRLFDHGHTWDGAPLSCAVGLAVLEQIEGRGLVDRVAARGPALLEQLREAVGGLDVVGEVRGRGFLLGVDLVDPREPGRFLDDELDAAGLVDRIALEDHGLLVSTGHSGPGAAGDQVTVAPAFTASDAELEEMVRRLAATLADVEHEVVEGRPLRPPEIVERRG